jgi:hypothetical protein
MSELRTSESLATRIVSDMDNLRHMLGARSDNRKRDWGYRNHYCTSPGGDAYDSMVRLEAAGLVKKGRVGVVNVFFHATEAGCRAIGFDDKQTKRAVYGD